MSALMSMLQTPWVGAAVSEDAGCSGKSESLFQTNDVDCSPLLVFHPKTFEAKDLDSLLQLKHLHFGDDLADEALNSCGVAQRKET